MSEITEFKNKHTVTNNSEKNSLSPGFERSLKPFINLVKLLTGVDITRIKTAEKKGKFTAICIFLNGIFMLFLNVAFTAIFNHFYTKQRVTVVPAASFINGTSVLLPTNAYINYLTVMFISAVEYAFICGMQFCFFALQSRFKELWESLLIIEKEFKICPFTYRSIKLSIWIGSVIIPLVRNLIILSFLNIYN